MALVRNPAFARYFARFGARNEERGNRELRIELLAGLSGTVLEVGAGTGLNFPHYPSTVDELLAVEPEPTMRHGAERTAERLGLPVRLLDATADRLPVPDGSVHAVVVSGVLCSVADPGLALAEFRRVLAADGELRFYEHVRSRGPVRSAWQDLARGPWAGLMGGCEPNRDTLTEIRAAGFRLEHWREFVFPAGARISLVGPRILGVARPEAARA